MRRLQGLIAATFTPMHADGSLHLELVPAMVGQLRHDGVEGLYVVGSTGEGPSLTTAERCTVAEAFVSAADGLPIVVQVGHNSIAEARTLAAHAQRIGAQAISATPPSYFKPDSVATLVRCMAEIAGAAPKLPFYYYHIPAVTGVDVDPVDFLSRGGQSIQTLAGLKFTSPNVDQFQACVELEDGRFNLLYGRDEMLLAGMTAGAQGAVGSTYNFAAPLYRRVIDCIRSGDVEGARKAQAAAVEMIRVVLRYGTIAALKAVMPMVGLDCGPVRLPLNQLNAERISQLHTDLEATGTIERRDIAKVAGA